MRQRETAGRDQTRAGKRDFCHPLFCLLFYLNWAEQEKIMEGVTDLSGGDKALLRLIL